MTSTQQDVAFGCEACKQVDADLAMNTMVLPLSARGERFVGEKLKNTQLNVFRVCINCALKMGMAVSEQLEEASEGVELTVKQ